MNEVRIIGNLADDPEVAKFQATALTKFVVIANGKNDKKAILSVTTFGKIAAWSGTLRKGQQVLVVGRIQTDQWKSDKGEPRSRNVVYADLVYPIKPIPKQNMPIDNSR